MVYAKQRIVFQNQVSDSVIDNTLWKTVNSTRSFIWFSGCNINVK